MAVGRVQRRDLARLQMGRAQVELQTELALVPWVAEQIEQVVRKLVLEVAVLLPWELLPHSTEGIERGPCRLWNHRGKSTFHNDCKRRPREGLDDRSTGRAQEL